MAAVVAPALGQRRGGGRLVPGEIVVKLRSGAVQEEIAGEAPLGSSRLLDRLEALHARYRVREIRPLLAGSDQRQSGRRRWPGGDELYSL